MSLLRQKELSLRSPPILTHRHNFDESVRPQDDLFAHANGGWLASTEIPADKSRYGAFDILADKAEEDVRQLVEEVRQVQNVQPGSATQKIRDYCNAFMDNEAANAKGVGPSALGWARAWRSKSRPEEARHLLTIDSHSPARFRANGTSLARDKATQTPNSFIMPATL